MGFTNRFRPNDLTYEVEQQVFVGDIRVSYKAPNYEQTPSYSSLNPSNEPDAPPYRSDDNSLPSFFPIHDFKSAPLISISETVDYLLLLGAFAKLKDEVVSVPTDYSLIDASVDPNNEFKLAIFVKRALNRFEVWWNAMESVRAKDTLPVNCAFCGNINIVPWVTLPRPNEFRLVDSRTKTAMALPAVGQGWAQIGFKMNCTICDETFGRDELKVRKLADDLGRCLLGKEGGFLPQLSLSHITGFTQSSETAVVMNQWLLAELSSHFPNPSDPSAKFDLGSDQLNEERKTEVREFFRGGMKSVQEIWDDHNRKIGLDIRKNAALEKTMKEFWGRYASTEARFGVDLTGASNL
ncbi:hypothetical protein [Phaffia rhodozyma]|uniref:Uncharacterized protein n=1 Tax=Phaffia rhodozyma TaxID=264483 RepID=A0A0F7SZ46_PHARH|nr:hypothetical protein [Phaffia rhodozyma]